MPKSVTLGTPSAVEQNVLRLDVAVDDTVRVCAGERARDRGPDLGNVPERKRALTGNALLERLALDVLEDDELAAVLLAAVKHGDDVRVSQLSRGPGLVREALERLLVSRLVFVEDLERDGALEHRVEGAKDGRHPAPADDALDLVPTGEKVAYHSATLAFPRRGAA